MMKRIHEKMALTLYKTFPLKFKDKYDDVIAHVKEYIRLVQLDFSEQLHVPQIENTEKGWFDFSRTETLNLEKIIRSGFKNSDRKKFPL